MSLSGDIWVDINVLTLIQSCEAQSQIKGAISRVVSVTYSLCRVQLANNFFCCRSDAEAETSTDELMINVEEDEADDERSESGDVESEDEAEGEDLETDEEMDNFFVKDAAVDDMD